MASYPNVNSANRYARDVVKGKAVACRYVKLACQRHLDDLKKSKEAAYPYTFDKNKAERVCRFIQLLPHTKGEWLRKRAKLVLEPWQLFWFSSLFGWVKKESGLRRFREAYCEIPRKNGKSALSAGLSTYMFCADNEFGAEVYCGATTEKQAWEVFQPARQMAKALPGLRRKFNIQIWAKKLIRLDGSVLEPIIGDPGDGASPSCAVVDEYHEHKDANLYDTMSTGMGAREQPLLSIITTAGDNIEGPCFDMRRRVASMLEEGNDDELFGNIYSIDEGDDWTTPEAIIKANPNAGISVKLDYLLSQQQKAIKNSRFTNRFKTKHLNIWVTAKSAFFNMEKWKECEDKTLTLEQFEGESCYLPLDLASKIDLVAMGRLFTRMLDGKRHYYSIAPRFWVPEDTVSNHKDRYLQETYEKYVNSEHLEAAYGAEVDFMEVFEVAKSVNLVNPVTSCPIDPHGAANLSHRLDDEGLTPILITQNFTNLSDPTRELEAAIASGRFHHDGNPILTWCMGNVVGRYMPGSDDVVRPIKAKSEFKIDGAVSLIMGVGQAMMQDQMYSGSVYDKGDVLC